MPGSVCSLAANDMKSANGTSHTCDARRNPNACRCIQAMQAKQHSVAEGKQTGHISLRARRKKIGRRLGRIA